MPAWILAALRLLAGGAAFGAGAELIGPRLVGGSSTGLVNNNPLIPDFIEERLPGERFFGGRGGRRRRRRRALTASDRADIAFIAGMISKAAAKDFAVQLAARPR